MDQVHECKKLSGQGKPLREIARQLGVSRNTVRAYVRDGKVPGKYQQRAARGAPVREQIAPLVRRLLEAEAAAKTPRKQRLTGSRIRKILGEREGIWCAETTVRHVVREYRASRRDVLEHAFVTLQYEPGRDAQVDFFEADVIEVSDGAAPERQVVRRHFLVVRMCYSRKLFVYAAPNQTREALLDGLVESFEYFGGVPQVLWFDNLTPAVRKVLKGRSRELQRGFEVFQAHYGFQSEFCRPARGNEKGGVENGVRHVERNAMSPMPEIRDRGDLQQLCRRFTAEDGARVPRRCTVSIDDAFELERPSLLPLPPTHFDPSPVLTTRVTNKSWVHHGTNAYSVPVELVGCLVQVRVGAEKIRIFANGLVAEHVREHRRNQLVLDIEHYLPLLERKARAVPHAAVVHQWIAKQDACWHSLLQVLQRRHGAYEGGVQFVAAIRLCVEHGAERTSEAVAAALRYAEVSLATVRYQLGVAAEAAATPRAAIEYAGPEVRTTSAKAYDAMLEVTCD